jgi:hypothetical protein
MSFLAQGGARALLPPCAIFSQPSYTTVHIGNEQTGYECGHGKVQISYESIYCVSTGASIQK